MIRRTLVYGALTATLGAAYLGSVLLIGLAVGRSGLPSRSRRWRSRRCSGRRGRASRRPSTAASTAAAMTPRRRSRRSAGRLREELDLEALGADLARRGATRRCSRRTCRCGSGARDEGRRGLDAARDLPCDRRGSGGVSSLLQGANPDGLGALAFAAFAGVGALIALRRPGNAVGWLLLGIAIFFAAGEVARGLRRRDPANPGRVWVAWLTTFTTNVWFSLALIFLPLLFPHGRLPSPRGAPCCGWASPRSLFGAVAAAFMPGRDRAAAELGPRQPARHRRRPRPRRPRPQHDPGAVAVVLAAASVVVRLRRARGGERQQLKWFAYVGVLAAPCLFVAVVGSVLTRDSSDFNAVAVSGGSPGSRSSAFGLPAATGIAILRHRLYDVDLVIRRTLVYGALTATLGATYLGLVLLVGLAVGESNVAIAVSTLAVAALFRPARARIQAIVDRRFYRRRYDATRTLEAFGGGCATSSTSRRSAPTCAASCARRSSPRTSRCG